MATRGGETMAMLTTVGEYIPDRVEMESHEMGQDGGARHE